MNDKKLLIQEFRKVVQKWFMGKEYVVSILGKDNEFKEVTITKLELAELIYKKAKQYL